MSDSKRETVDHWSFVEGVKNPLGRLADACLDAYEENGDPVLEEAANALRAIETVDLTGVNKCHPCKSLPWHVSLKEFEHGRSPVIASNGRFVQLFHDLPVCMSVVECINTVYSLKIKNGD